MDDKISLEVALRNSTNKFEIIEINKKLDFLHKILNYDEFINMKLGYERELQANTESQQCSVACTIIACNEERCIIRCIESVKKYFDEVIVVDTGSNDNTLQLLEKYKDDRKIKVYSYEWEDDFSKARNYAASLSNSDWVFFIDSDEYIESEKYPDCDYVRDFFSELNFFSEKNNFIISPVIIDKKTNQVNTELSRAYFLNGNLYYYGCVHEELRSFEKEKIHYILFNLEIEHDGYIHEVLKTKNKKERNVMLLKKMLDIEPDNFRWVLFYTRDGCGVVDHAILEKMLINCLLKDKNKKITLENIVIKKLTFELLDNLCKIKIVNGEFNDAINIARIMDKIKANNSNSFYYKKISEFLESKNKNMKLLIDTYNYRKNNFERQYGMMSTEGYHIDFLLAILLFENGQYAKSYKYFNFLVDKFDEPSILKIINEHLLLLEKYKV